MYLTFLGPVWCKWIFTTIKIWYSVAVLGISQENCQEQNWKYKIKYWGSNLEKKPYNNHLCRHNFLLQITFCGAWIMWAAITTYEIYLKLFHLHLLDLTLQAPTAYTWNSAIFVFFWENKRKRYFQGVISAFIQFCKKKLQPFEVRKYTWVIRNVSVKLKRFK